MIATIPVQEALRSSTRILRLHVLYSRGQVFDNWDVQVGSDHTELGRDVAPEAGLCLAEDACVSRQHATIQRALGATRLNEGGQYPLAHISDHGSTNGTWVNGVRMHEAALFDGDVIRVGKTLLLLREQAAAAVDAELPTILGRSGAAGVLRHNLKQAATKDGAVLISGETGVGKELAARAIHDLSEESHRRPRQRPYLTLNCASLVENLADSVLFGHVKHAFTDAKEEKKGYFREAEGGTLFLDEVSCLPLNTQAKLLRAVQEKEVTPLGSTKTCAIDVRVVAATNDNLQSEVQRGKFRNDLYSRLRANTVVVPSLRERREDILPLLGHFLGGTPRLSFTLADALLRYAWPHNVRELRQIADHLAAAHRRGEELDLPLIQDQLQVIPTSGRPRDPLRDTVFGGGSNRAHVPSSSDPRHSSRIHSGPRTGAAPHRKVSSEKLRSLAQEHKGNVAQISRVIGLSRRQIRRRLEKLHRPASK